MAAMSPIAIALFFFFTLAFSNAQLSQTQLVKGSVNCLDCSTTHDSHLSGIRVLVKCEKVKKVALAYTEEDGTFETQLPSDNSNALNCMAKIMGGPHRLYTSTKNSIVEIARASNGQLTISKPLSFFNSCPLKPKSSGPKDEFAASKTVDLPLPREWGLAPTSYYVPFFPIIGIP